ncbi:MAG: RteC domain-containing protein [Bacteroidetes bacterium]|nr:RteC domain-containing protein [Bacteroidota bacterium]
MANELEYLEKMISWDNRKEISDDYHNEFWSPKDGEYIRNAGAGIKIPISLPQYYDELAKIEINRISIALKEEVLRHGNHKRSKHYITNVYSFLTGLIEKNKIRLKSFGGDELDERLTHEFIRVRLLDLKKSIEMDFKHYLSPAKSDSPPLEDYLNTNMTDTEVLELVTALHESRSINNKKGDLTRKDAIAIFEKFLGKKIKDAESKLSRATARKKEVAPFLKKLYDTFVKYSTDKDE